MNHRDDFKLRHGPALKFKPSPRVNESKWRSAERLFEPLESRLQTKLNAKPSSSQRLLSRKSSRAHGLCARIVRTRRQSGHIGRRHRSEIGRASCRERV